ncbi:MAG: GWxTD domain-containing protein [Bacteroidia bacterium]
MNCKIRYSLFTITCLLSACTSQRYTDKSHDKEYKKENKEIDASYVVYHEEELSSRLYYSISNKDVIYKKTDTSRFFVASLKIFYKIIAEPDSKQILDSATVSISDKVTEVIQKRINGSLPFKYNAGAKSYMEISAWDENRKAKSTVQLRLNKTNAETAQNFLLRRTDSSVLYSSRLPLGTVVSVEHNRYHPASLVFELYKRNNKLPPPPFSNVTYAPPADKPDSSFIQEADKAGKFSFVLARSGIYCIKLSAASPAGCSVFSVDKDFPKVSTHEQMIACTRYILSKDEFNKLNEAADKQKAIDEFWLGIAGNADRARALIRKYYNRVQDANDMFSSSQEGWKMDRGMIYIIFGPPQKVYKNPTSEIWTYGNEGTPNSMQLVFDQVENKFSDNEYFLNRQQIYKDPWYIAVNAWREGRVYLDH